MTELTGSPHGGIACYFAQTRTVTAYNGSEPCHGHVYELPEVPEAPCNERTAHQWATQYWCCLGESPYTQRELMEYLQPDSVCLSQDEWIRFGVHSVPDFVVIGRHVCNLTWLRQQVPQWSNHPRYLPHDAA